MHHVSIGVTGLAAGVEFYQRLGLSVVANRPDFGVDGAWMQVGTQQVHLIHTAKLAPGAENHFALQVGNLDDCLAELATFGITALRLNYFEAAGHQAFINDPSGNVVELNQPTPGR